MRPGDGDSIINYVGMCGPKGMVYEPFYSKIKRTISFTLWSEKWYDLCILISNEAYLSRRNLRRGIARFYNKFICYLVFYIVVNVILLC